MKRIYRSRQDRMVCGVCGGIAEYFDLDPSADKGKSEFSREFAFIILVKRIIF